MRRGQVLANRYRLLSLQGAGGMGDVWRAEHVALRSPVAVKLLGSGLMEDPEAMARFVREAQAAAWLRSPHVVQVLDCGTDQGLPFIVMELLEGETLAERIAREQRLSPVEAALIITHVARAVGKAHEAGVVHRDLKPDNIFLVRNDDEMIAKVLDFGVAKIIEQGVAPLTCSGTLLGTPAYMSPEQACGETIDYRTDIWALGVTAFECLVGQRAFSTRNAQAIVDTCVRALPVPSRLASVPDGFDEWFARAAARQREHRFRSAREAAARLREVCGLSDVGPFIRASSPDFSSDPDLEQRVTLSIAGLLQEAPVSEVLQRSAGERRSGATPVYSATSVEVPRPSTDAPCSGIEPTGHARRSAPIIVESGAPRRTLPVARWVRVLAVAAGLLLLALAVVLALART